MAITNCPSCNKKISDKAQSCPFCGFSQKGMTKEDELRKRNHNRYLKSQSINNQSIIAMLMFAAGLAYMHWGGRQPTELQYYLAIGCSGIGFVWYIVNRIRMVILKKFR